MDRDLEARASSCACACTTIEKKSIEDERDELSSDPRHDIANRMRLSRYESAIRRWVDALNERGARVFVEAAVHPEVRVERYGFGDNLGHLMQIIQGTSGVTEWFGLTPKSIQFEIAGPVMFESLESSRSSGQEGPQGSDDGTIARVRYQVSTVGFANGGTWRFELADDGHITWLEHRPDDLPGGGHQERRPSTGSNGE